MKIYSPHPDSIRSLFDNIASTYDLLNHLLSFGMDIHWRKKAVQELRGAEGQILDLATGTGDVAIQIIHQNGQDQKVYGLDFSMPMMKRAQRKISKMGLGKAIKLIYGDALFLPFRDNSFSASVIAFGLRNIVEKEKALSEMVRVIKPGGKLVILEFTLPEKGWMKRCFPIYFQRILPWLGGIMSGDRGAYTYLPKSVSNFPSIEKYEELMRSTGLETIRSQSLTGGIASMISGKKRWA